MTFIRSLSTAAAAALLAGAAWAQASANVTVDNAWARTSVPGQDFSGVFMTLTAHGAPLRLVGVSTPAAKETEIHETTMEGDVMRMRPVEGGLALPADKPVALEPGSYHVMLMGLTGPLDVGTTVPLTLRLRDTRGAESQLVVQVPVAASERSAMHPHHRH